MSKYIVRVHRKDTSDHAHKMKSGEMTGGSILKPESVLSDEQKKQRGWHTHLYQLYGKTIESMPNHDEPGHTHDTEAGETSGPVGVSKMDASPQAKIEQTPKGWVVIPVTGGQHGPFQSKDLALAAAKKLGLVVDSY